MAANFREKGVIAKRQAVLRSTANATIRVSSATSTVSVPTVKTVSRTLTDLIFIIEKVYAL